MIARSGLPLLGIVAVLLLATGQQAAEGASRPNVVLILADDLGWTDLGCYGSDLYRTPHLDRLAADGARFTQNYSACTVCSPTRAALLTGKYPARVHITDWIPGRMPENPRLIVPDFNKQLPHDEVTLAELFKDAGYTTASIGKWHLGGEGFEPTTQGFDVNIAGTNSGGPPSYIAPFKIPSLPEGKPGEYLTDRIGEEAVRWIDQVKDRPFFLYMPHFAVHTPIQPRPDLFAKYQAIERKSLVHQNAAYAAMLESLDNTVGQVRAKLDELKLSDNTLVIFTSDNGGRVPTTSNKPLRVGKGSCYEGGVRVPLIIHWPGVTRAGHTIDTPVITMDLLPTIAEIAGLSIPTSVKPDGVSLTPLLRGSGPLAERPLYWHYPHYQHYQQGGTTPYAAVRSGDFKLIEFMADGRTELYNIKADIGEQHDLAASEPQKVKALRDQLLAWQKEVNAQMPTRNPDYDASKPEHTPAATRNKR